MVNGYKTYITGALAIAYGVIGFALGYQDGNAAMGFIVPALMAMFIRHGITTEAQK